MPATNPAVVTRPGITALRFRPVFVQVHPWGSAHRAPLWHDDGVQHATALRDCSRPGRAATPFLARCDAEQGGSKGRMGQPWWHLSTAIAR